MSTFEAKVYKLKIEPHNNADTLELCIIGDYRSCVRKGQFVDGDLGVYIPEGAVVPDWLIEKLGLTGKLAGPNHNRVKASRLRGILSQGLVYPVETINESNFLEVEPKLDSFMGIRNITPVSSKFVVTESQDVADLLGLTKYEPPIPTCMSGEVFNAHGYTLSYDVENFKLFPSVIQEGEQVLITEKLHGTFSLFGYHPEIPHTIIASKGISGQGLAFKLNDANKDNLYIRSLAGTINEEGNDVINRAHKLFIDGYKDYVKGHPFYILGETYGKNVQDLDYGLTKPHFRAFDIYIGAPGSGGCYLSGQEFMDVCKELNLETVPVLYSGPYFRHVMLDLTNGKNNISGTHMREGVVVRYLNEDRRDSTLGRVILKSVSEAYLLRKGNTTELQ